MQTSDDALISESMIMISTSMRMPKALHEALMQKSAELGLSLSKTVAYVWEQSQKQPGLPTQPDYALLSYCLLRETIRHCIENGQGLIEQALQKSEALSEVLQNPARD